MNRRPLVSAVRRARARAREAGLRWSVVRYRTEPWTTEQWRDGYTSGHLDYFADLHELPRYSLILGYLTFLGGAPALLDVGCGQGLLRARMGHLDITRYVGVDLSAAAIERAKALSDDHTEFVVGDVLDLAFGPAQFDVVVCNEVLSVAADPGAVLDRAGELLRPGGHLLTSTWRHPGDEQLLGLIDERFDLVDAVDARNPANPIALRGWRVTCHRRR